MPLMVPPVPTPVDEVRDPAVGVGPDLRAGGRVVAVGALGVGVLVRLPAAVDLLDQPVADRVVGVGVVRRDGGRGDDHLGAVGLEDVALVLADLVRAHEDAAVALALGDEGQADTGVAGGRLDDGAAGLERAGGLRGLDHAQGDAVLHGPTGVHVLHLGQHRGGDALGDDVELDEGRVPDEVGDVFGILHPPIVSDSGQAVGPGRFPAPGTGPPRPSLPWCTTPRIGAPSA